LKSGYWNYTEKLTRFLLGELPPINPKAVFLKRSIGMYQRIYL
jgi:hypothetical protein